MQNLDGNFLQMQFDIDAGLNIVPIVFLNGDVDDSVAYQTQRNDSASSKEFSQEQFRMVAQNMQESGTLLYLFC